MKRTLKKGIAFFLFLAMSLQLFVVSKPVTIHAEEMQEAESEFVIYDDYLAEYNGTAKDLVIPDDLGVSSIYLSYNENLESITVPEGIKNVSLYGLPNLNKINLSSTVTSFYMEFCPAFTELDLSDMVFTDSSYVDIWECENLKKIIAKNAKGSFYFSECGALTTIDVEGGDFKAFYVSACPKIKRLDPEKAEYVVYAYLSNIEEAVIPQNASNINLYSIDFDKVVLEDNYAGFFIKDGGLYNDYDYDVETENAGEKNRTLLSVDTTRKAVSVIDGTKTVGYLDLSGNCYTLDTIKLPDSVEDISYGAFYGGESIKNLNIPKNVVTLGAYSFSGISANLVIPESVRYISDQAFVDYFGKLSIKKDTDAVEAYKEGIYFNYYPEGAEEKTYTSLIYYPYDNTTIEWKDDVNYIGDGVFKYTKAKTLNIPEGVTYLSIDLRFAEELESISLPSTLWYMDAATVSTAPSLKTVSVNKKNKYYKSYKNCLYDKDMTTLLAVPARLENIVVPEGVISLGFYVITGHYVEDEYLAPIVTLPKSASEDPENTFIDFGKAYLHADTQLAAYYQSYNESMQEFADEGYDPYLFNYEFRDSNKALLNMIYCVDEMSIKKGKKDTAIVTAPLGMSFVSTLTKNNNTECKISFSSSDKSIATVNSKTGLIKAKKQGTCTINVKCTLTNGKKTNTKKFKIRLKVK